MGRIKGALAAAANWAARPLGVAVVPAWRWREFESGAVPRFRLGGAEFPFFLHHDNCGANPANGTERAVELALADRWLSAAPADRVVEVGAVTPYYWPGRVRRVADPADRHPAVTDPVPVERLDLTGRAVLSLSTFEHIGSGEYGLAPDPAALRAAVDQLCRQAESFLVTVPTGYAPGADAVFLAPPPPGVSAHYLVREPLPPYWREVGGPDQARRGYGAGASPVPGSHWANGLVVWDRGGLLFGPPPPRVGS